MRATIISMVTGLPGSLPGMSVAGGLWSARKRGAVSRARGRGHVRARSGLRPTQPGPGPRRRRIRQFPLRRRSVACRGTTQYAQPQTSSAPPSYTLNDSEAKGAGAGVDEAKSQDSKGSLPDPETPISFVSDFDTILQHPHRPADACSERSHERAADPHPRDTCFM